VLKKRKLLACLMIFLLLSTVLGISVHATEQKNAEKKSETAFTVTGG